MIEFIALNYRHPIQYVSLNIPQGKAESESKTSASFIAADMLGG